MMAAAQPFISGAISKTVNLPNEATVEDVRDVYVESWRLGVKAIAVYRDGSKMSQPLSAGGGDAEAAEEAQAGPVRRRLPDERQSITHKFSVGEHEGYITVGLYEDGSPGEVFLTMSKEGSTISGLMDAFATMTSLALQYGVPLEALVRKFSHMRFEPQGFTSNKQIPMAKSLIDYIFRWLSLKFVDNGVENGGEGSGSYHVNLERAKPVEEGGAASGAETFTGTEPFTKSDGVACHECGAIMLRSGTCYVCANCGANTGCG